MVGTIASVGDRGLAFQLSILFWMATVVGAFGVGGSLVLKGSRLDIDDQTRTALVLIATMSALAIDAHIVRVRPPYLRRQVSRLRWSDGMFRASAIWGLELGVGVATFVPSAALFLIFAYALADASLGGTVPLLFYGLVRGGQPAFVLLVGKVPTASALLRMPFAAAAATLFVIGGTILLRGSS
jgi:hypothetical protein